MKRWSALWALALVFYSAYAPALADLKPTLSATDCGTIWFASAGSLVRSADGSLTTGDPVVLSGDLGFPSNVGPLPAVVLAHGCTGILPGRGAAWALALREGGMQPSLSIAWVGAIGDFCPIGPTRVSGAHLGPGADSHG